MPELAFCSGGVDTDSKEETDGMRKRKRLRRKHCPTTAATQLKRMPAPQFWKFPSSRFPPSHNKPAPVVHDSSDICLCNECSRRQYNPIQVTSVTKATPIAIETSVVFKCEVCKFETKHSKEKHEFVCEYQN